MDANQKSSRSQWSNRSSRLRKPLGKFSPAHRDNKDEPWCATNPNQSWVKRHLGEVQPPERSGNRWRWFEERAPRPLNPRNKRLRKNQDGNHTQNGETWRTDSWTNALWMDPYVSWKRTRPNQDVLPVFSGREAIHPYLTTSMSLKRLDHQMRKLKKQPGMLQKYDDIIQDQSTQGTMQWNERSGKQKERSSTFHTKP